MLFRDISMQHRRFVHIEAVGSSDPLGADHGTFGLGSSIAARSAAVAVPGAPLRQQQQQAAAARIVEIFGQCAWLPLLCVYGLVDDVMRNLFTCVSRLQKKYSKFDEVDGKIGDTSRGDGSKVRFQQGTHGNANTRPRADFSRL